MALLLAPAWVLKVEKTLVVWTLPHSGQGVGALACGRKVRRSKVMPHVSQAYSKIGIHVSFLRRSHLCSAFWSSVAGPWVI